MNPLDIAGHFAYVFLAVGAYLLGKKNKWGWVCHMAGGLAWIIIGVLMGWTSIWMWGILFMFIDIKGFWTWWKWEGKYADQN
jgi:hypothetical protein